MRQQAPGNSERPRRLWLRLACRWAVLIAAVASGWPLRQESVTSVFLPALSPFLALGSVISVRTVSVLSLVAFPVLLLVVVFPRWFCRYGCPVGLLQELVERVRPKSPTRWLRFPGIGKWLALLTLGGACLGYPIFLWLDPLALFNGFLNAWRQPLAMATLLTGLGLPLLLLLDLALPRLWCQRICPLGATQDLLALPRRWLRQPSRCAAPDEPRPLTPSLSRGGGEGDRRSGEGERASTTRPSYDSWSVAGGRRWFLAVCAGAAGAASIRATGGQSRPPLRPPGSLDERRFTGVCVRCGNCAQACPSKIIQPDFGASGVAGFLTPRLCFDDDYCREDCHRCNEVCPSGAIARLPLTEKRRRVIGPAEVDVETCLLANGRECTACIKHCPYEAIVMHSADGGFSTQPRVDLTKCTGCGACEAVCPVRPRRAIRVVARPGVLNDISPRTSPAADKS